MDIEAWMDQADRHWRKHQPVRYQRLQRAGTLDEALRSAADLTAEDMRMLLDAGFDWDQAWAMTRQLYLFPPGESDPPPKQAPIHAHAVTVELQRLFARYREL